MISLCLCYVCPLCAYLVHCFTSHFMLHTPIVCIRSTLFHIAYLLHMLIQHMNTVYYILNRCTLQYISCYVRPLCAYVVHCFTLHFCCICSSSI
ncbi:hypothetical protein HanRHA438_Chr07g0308791 [Helianthus annuus]|nr:hypothetical protein HanRHA438_Chr07g0308791 [Helianthus annuus]